MFLPKYAWIRPWLLQRRITQGLWLAVLFLLVWLPDLLGHERVWFRTLCCMGVSFLVIASLPGPSGHILAARKVMYARKDRQQTLFQDAYNAEGNNACRLTVYYDGGRTRVTVLVAIEEREGCYLFKEMTCLPEEIDSEGELRYG